MLDKKKVQPQAVALRYDKSSTSVPKVVAAGRGDLAEQIIAAAQEAGIDIVEDPDLMEVLARIPLNDDIPEELFQAIAEILAFVYRINGRYASSHLDVDASDLVPTADS